MNRTPWWRLRHLTAARQRWTAVEASRPLPPTSSADTGVAPLGVKEPRRHRPGWLVSSAPQRTAALGVKAVLTKCANCHSHVDEGFLVGGSLAGGTDDEQEHGPGHSLPQGIQTSCLLPGVERHRSPSLGRPVKLRSNCRPTTRRGIPRARATSTGVLLSPLSSTSGRRRVKQRLDRLMRVPSRFDAPPLPALFDTDARPR